MPGCLFRIIRTAANLPQDSNNSLKLTFSRCIAKRVYLGCVEPTEQQKMQAQ